MRLALGKKEFLNLKVSGRPGGLLYPTYFGNQRRDGRRMQNVHEAFSGEIGREGR